MPEKFRPKSTSNESTQEAAQPVDPFDFNRMSDYLDKKDAERWYEEQARRAVEDSRTDPNFDPEQRSQDLNEYSRHLYEMSKRSDTYDPFEATLDSADAGTYKDRIQSEKEANAMAEAEKMEHLKETYKKLDDEVSAHGGLAQIREVAVMITEERAKNKDADTDPHVESMKNWLAKNIDEYKSTDGAKEEIAQYLEGIANGDEAALLAFAEREYETKQAQEEVLDNTDSNSETNSNSEQNTDQVNEENSSEAKDNQEDIKIEAYQNAKKNLMEVSEYKDRLDSLSPQEILALQDKYDEMAKNLIMMGDDGDSFEGMKTYLVAAAGLDDREFILDLRSRAYNAKLEMERSLEDINDEDIELLAQVFDNRYNPNPTTEVINVNGDRINSNSTSEVYGSQYDDIDDEDIDIIKSAGERGNEKDKKRAKRKRKLGGAAVKNYFRRLRRKTRRSKTTESTEQ